jgi:hypothetical protein
LLICCSPCLLLPFLFRSAAPLVYFSHLCSGLGLFVYLSSALQLPLFNSSLLYSGPELPLSTSTISVLLCSSPYSHLTFVFWPAALPVYLYVHMYTYPLSVLPTSSFAYFSYCSSVL